MKITKRYIFLLLLAAGLLIIPLLAMFFDVAGVQWSLGDFLIMALLLFCLATAIEYNFNKVASKNRYLFMAIAIIAFLLIWASLAVGLS